MLVIDRDYQNRHRCLDKRERKTLLSVLIVEKRLFAAARASLIS